MGNYRTQGQLQSACKENKNLEPCKSRQPYKAALVTASVMPDDGRHPPPTGAHSRQARHPRTCGSCSWGSR